MVEITNLSLNAIATGHRPVMGFVGDSKAGGHGTYAFHTSALMWTLMRDCAADLDWNSNSYANGGYNYGVGGSTSAQMVSVQIPQVQARTPDILWLETGNNDGITTVSGADSTWTNILAMITAAQAAGTEIIILLPLQPRSSAVLAATTIRAMLYLNDKMRAYAKNNRGVVFLDVPPLLIDFAQSDYRPRGDGGVTGSSQRPFGAMTQDGLHNSVNGVRAMASLLTPLIRRICRERFPRVASLGDTYSATENPYGNQLGTKGLFAGTNGTLNAVANAGVAAGWSVTTAGGLTVTPSLTTGTLGRLAGVPVQQFVLGGTATTGANLSLNASGNFRDWEVGSAFDGEAIVRYDTPGNISAPNMIVGGMNGTVAVGDTYQTASSLLPTTATEEYFMYLPGATPARVTSGSSGNPALTLQVRAGDGLAISGTVQIGLAGVFLVQ